jgi:hypothetical protein
MKYQPGEAWKYGDRRMVRLLKRKLTEDEFLILQELLDSDGPAGPLWRAMSQEAQRMRPELFTNPSPKEKK